MKYILNRPDNLLKISLKENIDQRRKEDIDRRLLPLLLDRPLLIHISKYRSGQSILIKEDDRHRLLLLHLLHNQKMITVDAEVVQIAKDSGSDSEAEVWSFNRAINEVFRLLPQELCPHPARADSR